MKSVKAVEILSPVRGVLFRGNEQTTLTHVTAKPAGIRDHTLYFHLKANSGIGNALSGKKSVVVVCENPAEIERKSSRNVGIIKVKNVQESYWGFVSYYRNLFQIPVIGITGTCGKTTTTELIKHILKTQNMRTQATVDGQNSVLHNLKYLAGIDDSTQAAVFELGVSHPGCIDTACRHFRPQVGVLLNIGVYHLLGCKTFENYVRAKAELLDGVDPQGTLVINADDENIRRIDFSRFKGKLLSFGKSEQAAYRASAIAYAENGMTFTLTHQDATYDLFVPGLGEHSVYNAIAAIGACHAIGIPLEAAGKAIATFQTVRRHLEFKPGLRGCTIIDDTWNCTPPSMAAALQVLKDAANGKKTIAVLGYMPQLGDNAKNEYDKIADKVIATGVDMLVVIGEAHRIGKRAIKLGMAKDRVKFCKTAKEVFYAMRPFLNAKPLILFKFPFKYRLSKIPAFKKLMRVMAK
ncbi:Mur ligase family protein [Brevibacillus fluminis]|uniref:Mur ligase family protein n=1 Tax=Brevibacillus fluminis TaxID=511487 RepID=UPI003F88EFC6